MEILLFEFNSKTINKITVTPLGFLMAVNSKLCRNDVREQASKYFFYFYFIFLYRLYKFRKYKLIEIIIINI